MSSGTGIATKARIAASGRLEADLPAEELRRLRGHPRRIAGGEEARRRARPEELRPAGKAVLEARRDEPGLRIDLYPGSERLLEDPLHQGVMRAAEHRRLRMRHPPLQRLDVALHQRLGEDLVALLDRVHDPPAGLGLHVDADGAEGELALEGTG